MTMDRVSYLQSSSCSTACCSNCRVESFRLSIFSRIMCVLNDLEIFCTDSSQVALINGAEQSISICLWISSCASWYLDGIVSRGTQNAGTRSDSGRFRLRCFGWACRRGRCWKFANLEAKSNRKSRGTGSQQVERKRYRDLHLKRWCACCNKERRRCSTPVRYVYMRGY